MIETYWAHYRGGMSWDYNHLGSFHSLGGEFENDNYNGCVFVDWATLTVTWDACNENNRPWEQHIGSEEPAWDAAVARMTKYLRTLDSQYNALCPND